MDAPTDILAAAMIVAIVYLEVGREKLVGGKIKTGEYFAGALGSRGGGGAFLIGNAEIIAGNKHLNLAGKLND